VILRKMFDWVFIRRGMLFFLMIGFPAFAIDHYLVPDVLPNTDWYLSAKVENDSMGVGLPEEWDDLRTHTFEINLLAPQLEAKLEYDWITFRGFVEGEGRRSDLVSLALGYPGWLDLELLDLNLSISSGLGLRYIGNLGAYFFQGGWHGLVLITRPVIEEYYDVYQFDPFLYSRINLFYPGIELGYSGVLHLEGYFDGNASLTFWFAGRGFDAYLNLHHVYRSLPETNALRSMLAEYESGLWFSTGVAAGLFVMQNSINLETSTVNFGLGFQSRKFPSENRPLPGYTAILIGPSIIPFAMLSEIHWQHDSWGNFLLSLNWQQGNASNMQRYKANHFQQLFIGTDFSLFQPGTHWNLNAFISADIGIRHNRLYYPRVTRVELEEESLALIAKAGIGFRYSLKEPFPFQPGQDYGVALFIDYLVNIAKLSGEYAYAEDADLMVNPMIGILIYTSSRN
jgi:hypothetical protein